MNEQTREKIGKILEEFGRDDYSGTIDQALTAIEQALKVDEEKVINLMQEYWQARDMIHGSIIDEKRRDRIIKLIATAIANGDIYED